LYLCGPEWYEQTIGSKAKQKITHCTGEENIRIQDTMNIYSHIEEDDQIEAINALPGIPGVKKAD